MPPFWRASALVEMLRPSASKTTTAVLPWFTT